MRKHAFSTLLFVVALGLALFYGFCHVLGWREHTAILSGTFPASTSAAYAGVLYILAYLGAVLWAPLFAFTAVFLLLKDLWVQHSFCRWLRVDHD